MNERMTVQRALQAARDSADGLYGVLLENASMELGCYKPGDALFVAASVDCERFGQ
jgi:hypothetical protein